MNHYEYDAFMCYSHSADSLVAPELQRLIRRVGRPWYARSTLRIFRDQTNLEMSESLWGSIAAALGASASFVLMASPAAARSPWVDREVRFWREHQKRSKFYIVLTDGEIAWCQKSDFDWSRTTALPKSLSGWFEEEPGWMDVRRPPGTRTHRNQRNDRLRDAARTIAAPLYGLDKDQLDGEDERESRRTQWTLGATIATLSVLTILALVAAGVAFHQYRSANERLHLATARLLLPQAEAMRHSHPRTALLLAEAAQHIHPDPESRSALIQSLLATRYTATLAAHSSWVESVAFAPDGRILVTGSEDDTAIVWDLSDPARPRRLGQPLTGHTDDVSSVAFAPDGRTLATGSDDYSTMLWDLTGFNSLRDHAPERACAITGGGLNPDEWARYVPGLAYEDACAST